MRHQPSRFDTKALEAALVQASNAPRITPQYLAELAKKRDQHYASLKAV